MSKHAPLAPRATINKAEVFATCKYVPTPPQEIVHAAGPHDSGGARFRWISAGVRTGKTTAAAMELVAAVLAPTPRATEWWCAAPTHSLADRCFKAVCQAFTQHLPEHVIRLAEHEGSLLVRNLASHEALILRRSTERPISLVGAGVDGMVIDEASGISDDSYESGLSTRILDRMGWVLGISSPRGTSGFFAKGLARGLKGGDPDIFGVILPTHSNPRISKGELRKLRASMEEWRFRQEYLGEPVAADGKVFAPESIDACSTGRFLEPVPGESYVAGLDIAGTGADRTVLVVARQANEGLCEVARVWAWSKLPFELMTVRVRSILRKWNDAYVRVDETGLGSPVLQQLTGAGVPASGVTFTASSKNAMVRNLAVMLERERIILPMAEACPMLDDELRAFEYLDSDTGSLGGHRKMAAPGGQRDDHVAGLLLASSWFVGGSLGGRLYIKGRDMCADDDEPDDDQDEDQDQDDGLKLRGEARVDAELRRPPPAPGRRLHDFDLRTNRGWGW